MTPQATDESPELCAARPAGERNARARRDSAEAIEISRHERHDGPLQPAIAVDADDEALLDLLAQGNTLAFSRLYSIHHVAVYRIVCRLLGRAQAAHADEVFRQTWMRLMMPRERERSRNVGFRAALFALAVRCVAQAQRGGVNAPAPEGGCDDDESHHEPWQPTAFGDIGLPPGVGCDDDSFYWQGASRRLFRCLEALAPTPRALVVLYHGEDVPLDELALALDLDLDAAKRQLLEAQFELQQGMGAYLWTDLPTIRALGPTRRGRDDVVPRDERLRAAFEHAVDHEADPGAAVSTRILADARRAISAGSIEAHSPAAHRPQRGGLLRSRPFRRFALVIAGAFGMAALVDLGWALALQRLLD